VLLTGRLVCQPAGKRTGLRGWALSSIRTILLKVYFERRNLLKAGGKGEGSLLN